MMHTELTTIAGKETLLLLVKPDWSAPVRTTVRMESEVTEGVSGIQQRRARHAVPRFTMRHRCFLTDSQLQTLRSVLGGLDGRPVAVPFWPDQLNTLIGPGGVEQTDIASRALNAQVNVGWNGAFQNVQCSFDGELPQRDFRGALLVGRLSPLSLRAITDTMGEFELTFIEDSPWECRAPAASEDPGQWSEQWTFDWSDAPSQSQRLLTGHESLGRGRESAREGEPHAHFWRQAAKVSLERPAIADLLAFHCARRGAVEAFAMPGVLQPGVSTPNAPHQFDASNARVRFTRAELSIDWITPTLATAAIEVEQQIETTGIAQQVPSHAHLYRFELAGESMWLTDWESPVEVGETVWTPARIEHGRIRQTLIPQNEDCEITVFLDDIPLIEPLARLELETPAKVEIHEIELPGGTPRMLFSGTLRNSRLRGKKATLRAAAFAGALGRRIPRFQWSVTCNHTLFSHGCSRRRPQPMDPANFLTTGLFHDQWPDNKLLLTQPVYPGSPPPGHYYEGGWVETGAGATRQVREILASWTIVEEGQLHLLLARAIRLDQLAPGQVFKVYPGCDGRYSTCSIKFNNTENFGGFPFMPAWIEQAPAGAPPKTGK